MKCCYYKALLDKVLTHKKKNKKYLHFNDDVRGQWSTVVTVGRTGHHSLTSLFPLGSLWLFLRDQLSHSSVHIRVWSRWTTKSLHHAVIPALPLPSYECFIRENYNEKLMEIRYPESASLIYNGNYVLKIIPASQRVWGQFNVFVRFSLEA